MWLWFENAGTSPTSLGLWVRARNALGGKVELTSVDAVLCPLDASGPRDDGGAPRCSRSQTLRVQSANQLDGLLVVPDSAGQPLVAARLLNEAGGVLSTAFVRPPRVIATMDAGRDATSDAQDASDATDSMGTDGSTNSAADGN